MYKKVIWIVMSALLLVGLAACQPAQAATTAQSPAVNTTPSPAGQGMEISASMRLAVGTLKLEGTDQAVTAEQAAALLPLWKAVRSLATDQTVSQVEIDALYTQIEDTMTAAQMQAIDGMDLSQEDIAALMAELGVQSFRPDAQSTPGSNSSGEFQMPRGDFGGGVPPGDFGGGGGGSGFQGGMEGMTPPEGMQEMLQGTPSAAQATAIAGRAGRMNQFNPFAEVLIQLLQERAAE